MTLDTIPSPGSNTIRVGGFQLHMYAVMIMAGIVVAVVISERRLRARGFPNGTAVDLVVWAVPCGIVGARLYHVITVWKTYFGAGGDPVRALYIWQGGLGIWGAIAGGGLGVYIAARRRHLSFVVVADAVAPALPVAQAIGRWGNWWNQEILRRSRVPALGRRHQQGPDHPRRDALPADLPLRVAVGRQRRADLHLGGPPVPARPWPGLRALRRAVLRRPVGHGGAAVRPCQPRPGAARQRVGQRRPVRRGSHLPCRRQPAPEAAG